MPQQIRTDQISLLRVLAFAIVAFLSGLAIIYFVLKPGGDSVAPAQLPPNAAASVAADETEDHPSILLPNNPSAPTRATAPPPKLSFPAAGPTPEDLAIKNAIRYLKCWDKSGIEYDAAQCDNLSGLEKVLGERLYLIDACKKEQTSDSASGLLTVAAEIDFANQKVSFWNAATSTMPKSAQIGTCVRAKLFGLPLEMLNHRFARYRFFFDVTFGTPAPTEGEAAESGDAPTVPSTPPPGEGKLVSVIKDKVNVRETPIDGKVFGRISTGNSVRLLEENPNGWCRVMTPNNNEGWMICSALEH